ncbi:MAG: hypothetical protein IKN38_10630 [Clostridia bacterium]|nr:hypothetical protein [Clostridia bacterium]
MKNTKLKDADAGYAESERPVYTESDELRAARDALAAAESAKPKEYSSAYSKDIEDLAKRILSGEKFSYDFNADPVYNAYRESAEENRRRTMADAASSAALLTGGYANSYGVTASSEASAKALGAVRELIPSLMEAAYKKWYGERELEREKLRAIMDLEDSEYGKYRDSVSDYFNERDYRKGVYSDLGRSDYDRYLADVSAWENDRDYDRRVYEYENDAAYKAERDRIEDEMKQKQYELDLMKANLASSGSHYSSSGADTSEVSANGKKKAVAKLNTDNTTIKDDLRNLTSVKSRAIYEQMIAGLGNTSRAGKVSKQLFAKIKEAKRSGEITNDEYEVLMNRCRRLGVTG